MLNGRGLFRDPRDGRIVSEDGEDDFHVGGSRDNRHRQFSNGLSSTVPGTRPGAMPCLTCDAQENCPVRSIFVVFQAIEPTIISYSSGAVRRVRSGDVPF